MESPYKTPQKLEHQRIASLKAPDKRIEIFDTHEKGLGLRVTPVGSKSFFYRYRIGGRTRRFKIGNFPGVSLSEARDKVRKLKVDVDNGLDPQGERLNKKYKPKELTFKELAEIFSKRHLSTLKKRTRDEYQRIIDVELLKTHKWGAFSVNEITSQHVREVLNKKAFDEDSFTMANRIRSTISKIFEFGLTHVGLDIQINPVKNTPVFKQGENVRERIYTEDEIKELWEYWETKPEPIQTYYKFLLITGQRRTETMQMKWQDIEKDKACKRLKIGEDGKPYPEAFLADVWTIQDNKSSRVHEVPLSDTAKELLERLKPITGKSKYVFQSPVIENQPLSEVKSTTKMIQKNTSIKDFRLHDLRRTVATKLEESLVDEIVIKKILNHQVEGVTGRHYQWYNYTDKKLEALNRWCWRLESILKEKTSSAKIHKIG